MSTPDESDSAESLSLHEQGFQESPAHAVVTRVAEELGRSPLEMAPLGEAIDPDSLNRLFDRPGGPSSVTVTFDYCGQEVTVTADGVRLSPREATGK